MSSTHRRIDTVGHESGASRAVGPTLGGKSGGSGGGSEGGGARSGGKGKKR